MLDLTVALGKLKSQKAFFLSHVPMTGQFSGLYTGQEWAQIEPYVDWITYQWYGDNGPDLVDTYTQFVDSHSPPPALLVGGQEFDSNSSQSDLTALTGAITSLNSTYGSDWGGVGIWAYPLPTDPDWSKAIDDALHA